MKPIARLVVASLLSACGTAPPANGDGTAAETAVAVEAPSIATDTADEDDTASLAAQPGPLLLTPDGWGPLRIGMIRAEVVAAAGGDSRPDAVGGADPEVCDEFRPANAAKVLVMIEHDVLTRISVSGNTDILTPAGFHVGDAGEEVVDAYGSRAEVTPHTYLAAPARYITVWDEAHTAAERRGIRYETDLDDAVSFIRGGGASIRYVEGCF